MIKPIRMKEYYLTAQVCENPLLGFAPKLGINTAISEPMLRRNRRRDWNGIWKKLEWNLDWMKNSSREKS